MGGPWIGRMRIVDLAIQPEQLWQQAAALLVDDFDEPRGWPNLEAARKEVAQVIREGFARAMVETDTLLGWVGMSEVGGITLTTGRAARPAGDGWR